MSCPSCANVGRSCRERPFAPPDADANALLYRCPSCGSIWHQYNSHFRLWAETEGRPFELVAGEDRVYLQFTDDKQGAGLGYLD